MVKTGSRSSYFLRVSNPKQQDLQEYFDAKVLDSAAVDGSESTG